MTRLLILTWPPVMSNTSTAFPPLTVTRSPLGPLMLRGLPSSSAKGPVLLLSVIVCPLPNTAEEKSMVSLVAPWEASACSMQ